MEPTKGIVNVDDTFEDWIKKRFEAALKNEFTQEEAADWNRKAGINNAHVSIRHGLALIYEGLEDLYQIYINGRGY